MYLLFDFISSNNTEMYPIWFWTRIEQVNGKILTQKAKDMQIVPSYTLIVSHANTHVDW